MNRHGWRVLESVHALDGVYCVDLFVDAGEQFGFAEFRADPEDNGGWTLIRQSSRRYGSLREVAAEALTSVVWVETAPAAQDHLRRCMQ